MTRHAWRLIKRRYSGAAFDGEGARLHGARWNSVGTRVAYAFDSKALAVLEVLVHLQSPGILSTYDFVGIDMAEALIEVLDRASLPAGWTDSPPPMEIQSIGDRWIAAGRSAVLAVPSVVVVDAVNYLINPLHPDFAELTVYQPEPYALDPRLMKRI